MEKSLKYVWLSVGSGIIVAAVLFACYVLYKNGGLKRVSDNEAQLTAIIWQQKSSEYRALVYQAFNIARVMIDQELKVKRSKKRAVVVDIDETLVNTSPYQAKSITAHQYYPKGWKEWCNMAIAGEIPGAREFLMHADSKGFNIFYVSNRSVELEENTIKNLKAL